MRQFSASEYREGWVTNQTFVRRILNSTEGTCHRVADVVVSAAAGCVCPPMFQALFHLFTDMASPYSKCPQVRDACSVQALHLTHWCTVHL